MRRELLILLPLFFSCDPRLVDPGPDPIYSNSSDLRFVQTNYHQYSLTLKQGTEFLTKDVRKIFVGITDGIGFVPQDSMTAEYDDEARVYRITIDASVVFPLTEVSVQLRSRYIRADGSSFQRDTIVSTLKYPYPSTEIVLTTSPQYVEDIDVVDSLLFGQNNYTVLIHNMVDKSSRWIITDSYEVLTVAEKRYLFYDHSNWSLYRYDLTTDSMDRFVYHEWGRFMLGLEYYQGSIYELLQDPYSISLLKYDLMGSLQDSIPIDKSVHRLTIKDGIAYMQRIGRPAHVLRYDLAARSFVDTLKAPANNFEGIRIRDGYVYFSDFDRRVVARFWFPEFFTHGRM